MNFAERQHTPSPVRFNMLRDKRKPLLRWLKEQASAFLPRQIYRDDESYYWMIKPWLVKRWLFKPGPYLNKGDAGWEEATHEVGFIYSNRSIDRLVRPEDAL